MTQCDTFVVDVLDDGTRVQWLVTVVHGASPHDDTPSLHAGWSNRPTVTMTNFNKPPLSPSASAGTWAMQTVVDDVNKLGVPITSDIIHRHIDPSGENYVHREMIAMVIMVSEAFCTNGGGIDAVRSLLPNNGSVSVVKFINERLFAES